MLNYKHTLASMAVPMQSGAQLTAESDRTWTSQSPNEKATKVVLKARGDLEERGSKWSEEWLFVWPDGDLKKLEDAFRLIAQHVEQRVPRGEKRREVFVDVYDWLRVGRIDEKGTFRGYVRVTKNGKSMDSGFEDTPALFQVRNALMQAMNS